MTGNPLLPVILRPRSSRVRPPGAKVAGACIRMCLATVIARHDRATQFVDVVGGDRRPSPSTAWAGSCLETGLAIPVSKNGLFRRGHGRSPPRQSRDMGWFGTGAQLGGPCLVPVGRRWGRRRSGNWTSSTDVRRSDPHWRGRRLRWVDPTGPTPHCTHPRQRPYFWTTQAENPIYRAIHAHQHPADCRRAQYLSWAPGPNLRGLTNSFASLRHSLLCAMARCAVPRHPQYPQCRW